MAVKFHTVKAGDTLYDVRRQKMGNTAMSRLAWWPVYVESIDHDRRVAMCRWNHNEARRYSARDVERLRRSIPEKLRSK